MRYRTAALLAASALACAQDRPVIFARGVTNLFTREPAPARVGLGSLIEITGLRLGPSEEAKAAGVPWPAELAGVEVLINGRPAPLYSVAPGRIVAQVPQSAGVDVATVVVRRGETRSAPARVMLADRVPAVKSADGSGYGKASGELSGSTLTLSATGLGAAEPALEAGEAGPAVPRAAIRVFVGGAPAPAETAGSPTRPGEYEVKVTLPRPVRPGDVIYLMADRLAANRTVLEPLREPEVSFLPLPPGLREVRTLQQPDLNGTFILAAGARGDDGCYPAGVFDFVAATASAVEGCLTAASRSAGPLVAPVDGTAVAALSGTPTGDAPNGVSSRVRIFRAGAEPREIELPGPANALTGSADGHFLAVMPGAPAIHIDSETGELRQAAVGGGATAPGAVPLDVDGLTRALSAPLVLGQGRVALVVGDDPDAPTRAKFAIVAQATGEVIQARDFPEGWLPLIGPAPQARPETAAARAPRLVIFFDRLRRTVYALAAQGKERHGFAAFPLDRAAAQAVPFPEGAYAPLCTPTIPVFNLELSRRAALAGSGALATELSPNCAANGFLVLDLEARTAAYEPLPAPGQMNVASVRDVNDYVYGINIDPSRRGQGADTVYVLDGATGLVSQILPPSGINSFADLRAIPAMNALIAVATDRQQGDQGLLVFRLDEASLTPLPVPAGFDRVAELDDTVFPATRKIVVRALRRGGSQLVVYDAATGEPAPVPNPEGVASIGPLPQAAADPGGSAQPVPRPNQPTPGQQPAPGAAAGLARLLATNAKANTVAAVCFDAEGKQAGIVLVRVP